MIAAVILAAGAGERLGTLKALAVLEGRTLLERVVDTCCESALDDVIVVTGAGAGDVEALLAGRADVRCIRNEQWQSGRTGSLQVGWAALPAESHALVFPVDHPVVRLVTLDAMLGVFGHAGGELDALLPVVEIGGERHRGHPVLLSSRFRSALLAAPKDAPLRDLLETRALLEVPVDDEGILLNINTPADLTRAAQLLRERAG